jgi:hypothetical protein
MRDGVDRRQKANVHIQLFACDELPVTATSVIIEGRSSRLKTMTELQNRDLIKEGGIRVKELRKQWGIKTKQANKHRSWENQKVKSKPNWLYEDKTSVRPEHAQCGTWHYAPNALIAVGEFP